MYQTVTLDKPFSKTSYASPRDEARRRFAEGLVEQPQPKIDWPDRHLVGLANDPVPFHEAQDLAYDSESRIIAMIAGTQSGKTSFGPWWMADEIDRTASPKGNNDYIIATSTYPLFKLKLLPSVRQVFENILDKGRYWTGDKVLELKDPSTGRYWAKRADDPMWGRIILLSANSPSSLESATARAAWLDEAGQDEFTLKAYQAILRRLSLHRGRQLFTTTLYNLGWVKSQIIDKAKKGGKTYHQKIGAVEAELIHTENQETNITLVQYDSILNPEFSIEEFLDAQSKMDEAEFKMFYKGQTAKLKSIIYDVFDPEIHVIPALEIPHNWPHGIVGVDPIGQKTAAIKLAFDPDKFELHLYWEYEADFGKTTQGHVNDILTHGRENDSMFIKAVGGGPSENQARLDWTAAGLPLEAPPITEVWSQISRVYALFKQNKLFIHDCCPRIISDLGTMKRKVDRHGNYTDIIENKDTWHLPDALRYVVAWLTVGNMETQVRVRYNPVGIR